MKKSWIIIIIVFLLATNLSLLATLIFSQKKDNTFNQKQVENRFNEKFGLRRPNNLSFTEEIAKELNMSPKQFKQLDALSQEFHESKRGLGRQINEMKHKYFSHLENKNVNEVYLNNLADSIGKLYTYKMQLDFNHYQNIKSICTPAQIEKFDSLGKNYIHKKRMRNSHRRHMNSVHNN
jgi:Spy/CpxP family protein refolding chaperone